MENRQVPEKLLEEWENQAMREGINNPHAFMSYIRVKTELYFQSKEEVSEPEHIYDSDGNLTAYGMEWASRSLMALPINKRVAKFIALDYEELLDYLSKRGQKSKKGNDLFDPEYFVWLRKIWYKRIIDRLEEKVINKSDIPFKEYRKFAYSKI